MAEIIINCFWRVRFLNFNKLFMQMAPRHFMKITHCINYKGSKLTAICGVALSYTHLHSFFRIC